MVWGKLKKLIGINKPAATAVEAPVAAPDVPDHSAKQDALSSVHWLKAEDTPWGVPVLDVRPFTQTMLSASPNPQCATNAVSFGQDDGRSFIGVAPKIDRTIQASVNYKIDAPLEDGVLCIPVQMEHKWAIFYHQKRIIAVRSWTRQVALVAHVETHREHIEITSIQGVFNAPDEESDFTMRSLDFLIRSHVLGLPYPAPLPKGMENDLSAANGWCFSLYGNRVDFATPHPFASAPPEQPMRSDSLLHIAVARADRSAIADCLAQGTSINALARDGLAPMHWALTAEDTSVMALLLERGAPVDVQSDEGATPLMNAVQSAKLPFITFLLHHGAKVNARDLRGFTALHRAAEMGYLEVARVLLQAGASPEIAAEGHSPRSLAEGRGNADVLDLLMDNRGQ